MDSSNFSPADNGVFVMRTLPWVGLLSAQDSQPPVTARAGALAFTHESGHGIAMPIAAAYRVSGVDTLAPCATATDPVITLAWGMNADHKFSTRLGPPPSPPV